MANAQTTVRKIISDISYQMLKSDVLKAFADTLSIDSKYLNLYEFHTRAVYKHSVLYDTMPGITYLEWHLDTY